MAAGYSIRSEDLIEEGHLTPPDIKMFKVSSDLTTPNTWPECYDIGGILNKHRNDIVVREAISLPKPCLIMVDQIGHGDLIQDQLKTQHGLDIPFVRGDTSKRQRLYLIEECKKGNVPIMIASTIFDEGLDIPNLKSLILAGGKKSEIKSIQRLGRGLREADGKDTVSIVDFYDTNLRY